MPKPGILLVYHFNIYLQYLFQQFGSILVGIDPAIAIFKWFGYSAHLTVTKLKFQLIWVQVCYINNANAHENRWDCCGSSGAIAGGLVVIVALIAKFAGNA